MGPYALLSLYGSSLALSKRAYRHSQPGHILFAGVGASWRSSGVGCFSGSPEAPNVPPVSSSGSLVGCTPEALEDSWGCC